MPLLYTDKLSHIYSKGTPFEKRAIDDITVSFEKNETIGILGHTGSGKSTFIQHLNALLAPSEGKVFFDGADINATKVSRHDIKFRVGLVFQYPEYQLFEETVFKDIAFGPSNMKLSAEEIDKRVREAAGFVGVDEKYFDKSPLELSGGQKRRVAIAGVIAMRPDVLILDEPTAGLDPSGCAKILENIKNYQKMTGATVIIVSHNMDEAASFAGRLIVFNQSKVVLDGSPEEVFSHYDLLTEIGLNVPQVTLIAAALREKGIAVSSSIYTREQLLKELLALKGEKSC